MSKESVAKCNHDAWIFPPTHKTPVRWHVTSRVVIGFVGICSKFWIEWLNNARVYNRNALRDVVENRLLDRGLVTISNHTSCLDDPLMWGLLKMRCLFNNANMRWIPTAEDVCFMKPLHCWFFSMGQCVPVRRGCGVYQKGMDFLLSKLDLGGWVHVFPEGKVNLANEGLLRFKWGVGRLIAECKKSPVVLPMAHVGMDDILPNTGSLIPRIRQNVTLVVGEPMDFTTDVEQSHSLHKSPMDIRKHITDLLQEELLSLREHAKQIHTDLYGNQK